MARGIFWFNIARINYFSLPNKQRVHKTSFQTEILPGTSRGVFRAPGTYSSWCYAKSFQYVPTEQARVSAKPQGLFFRSKRVTQSVSFEEVHSEFVMQKRFVPARSVFLTGKLIRWWKWRVRQRHSRVRCRGKSVPPHMEKFGKTLVETGGISGGNEWIEQKEKNGQITLIVYTFLNEVQIVILLQWS